MCVVSYFKVYPQLFALALPLDATLGELGLGSGAVLTPLPRAMLSPHGGVRSARAWLVEEKEREGEEAGGRVARRVPGHNPVLIMGI